MENFKSILFVIAVLLIISFIGYWAVSSIESGGSHVEREKQEKLLEENEELKKEIKNLKEELASLKPEEAEEEPVLETETPVSTPSTPDISSSYKHQSLINDLQKLIDDNIFMKEKSRGTRVGTVQTFLNLYNGTSKRIDNDYGATTKADIMKFQKAEGLTQDGEAGPGTFQKMIEWLKKQG